MILPKYHLLGKRSLGLQNIVLANTLKSPSDIVSALAKCKCCNINFEHMVNKRVTNVFFPHFAFLYLEKKNIEVVYITDKYHQYSVWKQFVMN